MTVKRLKIFIIFAGFLIILAGGLFAGYQYTESPGFCKSCHEMYPQYATWAESTHSKIACEECHVAPGAKNFFTYRMNQAKDIYKHFTNKYYLPIELYSDVTNETCLKCHSRNRKFTPDGDLVMPHYEHINQQMKCITCHQGLVHGQLSSGNIVTDNKDLDSRKWTPDKAKKIVSGRNSPGMELCMNCHEEREVTLDCNACHSTDKKPASHRAPDFLTGHGKLAAMGLKSCDFCHSYNNQKKKEVQQTVLTEDPTKDGAEKKNFFDNKDQPANNLDIAPDKPNTDNLNDYTLENVFCYNCHTKAPPSHSGRWIETHGQIAATQQNNCLICHVNRPGSNLMPTATTCGKCHPAIHPDKNTINHPVDIKGKSFGQYCMTCHTTRCLKCHQL